MGIALENVEAHGDYRGYVRGGRGAILLLILANPARTALLSEEPGMGQIMSASTHVLEPGERWEHVQAGLGVILDGAKQPHSVQGL